MSEIYEIREDRYGKWYICLNCGEYADEPFKECGICGLKSRTN